MTKFAFVFDNVRTSNIFSRFEIRRIFSRTRRRIRTSGPQDRHHMSTPTSHRNNQLNKCALANSLKGPKIILDMADRHVSKDGPFIILGNALTLHIYFRTSSVSLFFIFYHRHVNVWLNSHSNGLVLWNSHSTNANFSWLRHIPIVNKVSLYIQTGECKQIPLSSLPHRCHSTSLWQRTAAVALLSPQCHSGRRTPTRWRLSPAGISRSPG